MEIMSITSQDQFRYYERKCLVSFEEDEYNEFKGHRSISCEELPPWCFLPGTAKRSRKGASRSLAAFLNSGRGGTVYLGIIDEGVVKGLYLTECQKDHVVLSIKDTFSRYNPPVEDDKYQIDFVPVFGKDQEKILPDKDKLDKSTVASRLKPHLLRTFDFCWCDKELAERIDKNEQMQDYIIEVKIHPQKSSFKCYQENGFKAELPVVYLNEEGRCFFRKSACCVEYSIENVKELATQQLKDLYDPLISSLRDEIRSLDQT